MKANPQKLEDRLQKISELMHQRDEITAELAKLTGIEMPNDNAPTALPHGLAIMEEVRKVIEEKGAKMRILDVKKEIDRLHRVNLPRRNLQATMAYMVRKGLLQKEKEYGMYSLARSSP